MIERTDRERLNWLNRFIEDDKFNLDMSDLCYGHEDIREAIDQAMDNEMGDRNFDA